MTESLCYSLKLTKYCKSTILQDKIKVKAKKRNEWPHTWLQCGYVTKYQNQIGVPISAWF